MSEQFNGQQPNKVMAALAYVFFFIPLLACPNDSFAKYHANQGLLLLIVGVAGRFIGIIPFIGGLLTALLGLATFVLFIMGVINALNGVEKPLPIIGNYTLLR